MRRSSPGRSPTRNAGSPSKRHYETQFETEHRELVLSQLKAELFDLRKNQRDYNDLHSQLTNLEHRYNLLQEEKGLNEVDFKTRYEINTKNIFAFREQNDLLKKDYNDVSSSNTSLRMENKNINDLIESRISEINRLNLQIDDIIAQNERLDIDKKDLSLNLTGVKDENAELARRLTDLQKTQEDLNAKRIKNDKLIDELEEIINGLERNQATLNKEHDGLKINIYNLNDSISVADSKLSENKKIILHLDGDIYDMKKQNERIKAEINKHTTNYQSQSDVNIECSVRSQRLDDISKNRDNEIAELRNILEALKQSHFNLVNTNEDLNNDIEVATKHLETVTRHHTELVDELERYHQQDQKIRSMIDRKDKVEEVKVKVEDRMKQSANKMSSSLRSPQKRRNE